MNDKKLTIRTKATHAGTLRIGAIEIPCYVLEDGRHVLSQQQTQNAFGLARSGSHAGPGAELARFFATNTMKPFSDKVLDQGANCIEFAAIDHGRAYGFPSQLLVDGACAIDDADRAGVLGARYTKIVAAARTLIRSLAGVGLDALIDEATGYQEARPADDLSTRLEKLLADREARFESRLLERDTQHATELAVRDRRIDTLIDTQGVLARGFNESASYGSRMIAPTRTPAAPRTGRASRRASSATPEAPHDRHPGHPRHPGRPGDLRLRRGRAPGRGACDG